MARTPADTAVVTPWDARIARARELAPHSVTAGQILTFYAALAHYQQSLFTVAIADGPAPLEVSFVDAFPLHRAGGAAPAFLRWLAHSAPSPDALRTAASTPAMQQLDWGALIREALECEVPHGVAPLLVVDEPEPFVTRSLLQPFAEAIATTRRDALGIAAPTGQSVSSRCPICGDAPRVGVLREEGHGAKKTLQCGRCFTEWGFPRLMCPTCQETRFDALPVFTAETFPSVRVEACETCHGYLKTIDLTVDGLAVPAVDDLASISLDLWAAEHGYGPGLASRPTT